MAFLRFTRDKRGYQQFSLVEATTNRRGKSRSRLLYWYRTPPDIKVGREPFDEAVRRELEARNPGVQFDWRKIIETPIPSADADRWRERRRAEKAEKAARRAEAAPREPDDDRDEQVNASPLDEAGDEEAIAAQGEIDDDAGEEAIEETADGDADRPPLTATAGENPAAGAAANPAARRRRRRRGRRGRSASAPSEMPPESPAPSDRRIDERIDVPIIEAPTSEPEGN
jgi:hypothetical protein